MSGRHIPADQQTIAVDMLRGGHRFPEFLRMLVALDARGRATRNRCDDVPDLPIDRHLMPWQCVIIGLAA